MSWHKWGLIDGYYVIVLKYYIGQNRRGNKLFKIAFSIIDINF